MDPRALSVVFLPSCSYLVGYRIARGQMDKENTKRNANDRCLALV